MAIRNKRHPNANPESDRFRRKADQEWDMAGLARKDGDKKAEEKHTAQAREYEKQYREALGIEPPRPDWGVWTGGYIG